MEMSNIDTRLNSGKDIWEKNIIWRERSAAKLMDKMDEIFRLNIYQSSTEKREELKEEGKERVP